MRLWSLGASSPAPAGQLDADMRAPADKDKPGACSGEADALGNCDLAASDPVKAKLDARGLAAGASTMDDDLDGEHPVEEDAHDMPHAAGMAQDCAMHKPSAAIADELSDDQRPTVLSSASDEGNAMASEERARMTPLSIVAAIPKALPKRLFSRRPRKQQMEDDDDDEASHARLSLASSAASPADAESYASSTPLSGGARLSTLSMPSMPSLTRFVSSSSIQSTQSFHDSPTSTDHIEQFRSAWDEKLRQRMEKLAQLHRTESGATRLEKQRSLKRQDVFHLLLRLYAHQDVIAELYAAYDANPWEFEFYIPQLCTFLLHGQHPKQHQLECFLMSRSGESLNFAHRLGWFLKSFCCDPSGYKSEFLSVTQSPEDENANLLSAIRQRAGVPAVLMDQGLNIEEVSARSPVNLRFRRASGPILAIPSPCSSPVKRVPFQEEAVGDDKAFATYLQRQREKVLYTERPDEGNEQQIALYNATPDFVTSLTDLADRLIPVPRVWRNARLRQGLRTIHEAVLPSNVIYLPIGNSYHRVKAIQTAECFTFSTKMRVPYFLCVEVIDFSADLSASDEVGAKTDDSSSEQRPRAKSGKKKRGFHLKLRFKKRRGKKAPATIQADDASAAPVVFVSDDESEASVDLTPREHVANSTESQTETLMESVSSPTELPEEALGPIKVVIKAVPSETEQSLASDQSGVPAQDCDSEQTPKEDDEVSQQQDEQQERMGQWNLPRADSPKARERAKPSKKKAGAFDSFYSSWFSSKKKDAEGDDKEEDVPSTAVDDDGAEATCTSESSPSADRVAEPAPEPTEDAEGNAHDSQCQSDGEHGRETSVSLDFTDSTAWRLKFELDDILTDVEPDVGEGDAAASTSTQSTKAPATKVEPTKTKAAASPKKQEKPVIVFRERWQDKEERIRQQSPFGHHPGWRLLPVIVKSNDDLRQEQFAAQLIAQCDRIFRDYSLPLRLRPYNVIATSATTGLIEAVPDTVSLDSLKRNDPHFSTLLNFFRRLFGEPESVPFRRARRNFVESLAAYSMLCYVFQIKDRHNGNILLDTEGHLVHIDFGFMLTNSPGMNANFERAPFKLTEDFIKLMGGPRSASFRYFRSLCIRAFLALRRNMDKIVLLVEMMLVGNADLPCFAGGKRAVIEGLQERFKPDMRTSECQAFVNQLITRSINNWRTRWYDKYQRTWVGIL